MMKKAQDFLFDTPAQQGVRFSDFVKAKDYTYLIFLRYYGCTSCQLDLIELAEAYDSFCEKGAQILLALQSSPEILKAGIEKNGIPFELISDPDQKIYSLYGIGAAESAEELLGAGEEAKARFASKVERMTARGLEHGEYEGNELQLPAWFLVDKEMNLLKEHRAANITDMPMGLEYLEALPE